MKTLYLDCGMGAAGDMLAAALAELLPDPQGFIGELNALGIPKVRFKLEKAVKCGITGSRLSVTVDGVDEEAFHSGHHGHGHSHDHDHSHEHDHPHGHGHDHGHEHDYCHDHSHRHDHSHEHGHDHSHEHDHCHDHSHEHGHGHEHGHDHEHDHPHGHGHGHSHEHEHDHGHDHSHPHGHGHDHGHEHDHCHDHSHEHGHGHGHDHSHDHDHDHGHGHSHDHDHGHGHEHDHPHGHGHSHEHGHGHEHDHPHGHGHGHSSLSGIEHIVRGRLALPEKVKDDVMAVYALIAEAESRAHGVAVSEIHFHEVGAMDAVADIAAVCLLMDRLSPDEVVVSPVHVGSGKVRCAHGMLPVPAPATAHILQGVPIYGGSVSGELCTPTGAALLKHFATRFGDMPAMRTSGIGYGMGKRDFEAANCLRAMLGESGGKTDVMLELCCNVDDMTAEQTGFAIERLLEGGARDVYTVPIGMKKSRPGTLIRVICPAELREDMVGLMFRHTTTIGIRQTEIFRYLLNRSTTELDTPLGTVRRKDCSGYGVARSKYEYDDLARIARERGMSIAEVIGAIEK